MLEQKKNLYQKKKQYKATLATDVQKETNQITKAGEKQDKGSKSKDGAKAKEDEASAHSLAASIEHFKKKDLKKSEEEIDK